MNKIYTLVWSAVRGAFVVTHELAKSKGKPSSTRTGLGATSLVLGLMGALGGMGGLGAGLALAAPPNPAVPAVTSLPAANALPTGGQLVAGSASIAQTANRMDVSQSSQKAILNWQSFNIGSAAQVNFAQPNASAVALNRVLSSDPSAIYGKLTANGQVFLVNQAGVLFGAGSRVDVGALVASTMDVRDADFMAGRYAFGSGSRTIDGGSVLNQGTITAAQGGYVALLAPEVRNEGIISASLGTVLLAGAEAVTLSHDSTGLQYAVDKGAVQALVDNKGLVQADGGQVILSARAANSLASAAINNSGTLQASSLASVGGRIVLTGDSIALHSTSQLNATGATGGGTVLVGGDWQGASINGAPTAQAVYMAPGATIDASATVAGSGGKVVLWSENYTGFFGTIDAKGAGPGGNGGVVETSSHRNLQALGRVYINASLGQAGSWLLDPYDVTITDQPGALNTGVTQTATGFVATSDNAVISMASLQEALNAGGSVTISTGATGTQIGTITLKGTLATTGIKDATLTLAAAGDIVVTANSTITSGDAKLNTTLTAGGAGATGSITLAEGAAITTNGGDVTLSASNASTVSLTGANITTGTSQEKKDATGTTATTTTATTAVAAPASTTATPASSTTSTAPAPATSVSTSNTAVAPVNSAQAATTTVAPTTTATATTSPTATTPATTTTTAMALTTTPATSVSTSNTAVAPVNSAPAATTTVAPVSTTTTTAAVTSAAAAAVKSAGAVNVNAGNIVMSSTASISASGVQAGAINIGSASTKTVSIAGSISAVGLAVPVIAPVTAPVPTPVVAPVAAPVAAPVVVATAPAPVVAPVVAPVAVAPAVVATATAPSVSSATTTTTPAPTTVTPAASTTSTASTTPAGQGGAIVIRGQSIDLTSTSKVDASGATGGGSVVVGGAETSTIQAAGVVDVSASPTAAVPVAAPVATTPASTSTPTVAAAPAVAPAAAPTTAVTASAPVPAPAPTPAVAPAKAGTVELNAGAATGNVVVSGTVSANADAGKGGSITATANTISLTSTAKLSATGATGGGTVLVGGDWQGSGTLRQATAVSMDKGASINVSATQSGNGGKAVLWSDVHNAASVTRVDGQILAKGGSASGDGGNVETSGHVLSIGDNTRVSTLAVQGQSGTWLLDPTNFTISAGSAAQTTSGMGATTLQTALASGNVSITTSATANGSDLGDINIDAPLTWSANKLTLSAHHSVLVNDVVTVTQAGKLDITTNTETSDDAASIANVGYLKMKQARVNTSLPTDEFIGKITFSNLTYPAYVAYSASDPSVPAGRPNYKPLRINGNDYWVIAPEFIARAKISSEDGGRSDSLRNHMSYWYNASGGYGGAAPFYVALGQDFSGAAAAKDNGSGPMWNPLYFRGTFEGLGHTISDITIKNINSPYNATVGIFGLANSVTVNNFGIVNSTVVGTYSTDNTVANIDKLGSGGILGQASGTSILRNVFMSANSKVVLSDSSLTNNNYYYGGLVGWSQGDLTIVDSYNAAPIYSNSTASTNYTPMNYVGGLVGAFKGTATSGTSQLNVPLNIYNSYNVAEIRSGTLAATDAQRGNYVGGIIGYMDNGGSTPTSSLVQIKNYGDIYGKDMVSGIIGSNSVFKNTTMTKLTNNGNIYANNQAHGILYMLQSSTNMTLSYLSNTGNITTSATGGGASLGGLFNYFGSGSAGSIVVESSYNSGNLTATLGAYAIGGLMGWASGNNASGQPTLTFRNVYNTGNISVGAGANPDSNNNNKIGGLVGYDHSSTLIFENGYNSGNISYASNTGTPPYVGAIVGAYDNESVYCWDTFTNIYASGTYTKVATTYNADTVNFGLYGFDITNDNQYHGTTDHANTGASAKTTAELQVPPATLSFPTDKWGQSATINGGLPYLTGFAIPLTVTFGALSKTYGDAAYPSLVLDTNYTCSAGCNFAINWNPTTFGQYKAAGTYAYTTSNMFSLGSGADAYEITYDTTNSFVIDPRPINLTPTPGQSKIYGDANPGSYTYIAETAGSSRGLVNSDTFTGALARAAGETVGNYAFNAGTLTNSNYTISVPVANFAVTQRSITLTATSASKTYGDADPTLAVTVTGGGLATVAQSDTLADITGTLSRQTGNNVGVYDIALANSGGGGTKASNYTITYVTDNNALTINKRTLTLSATKAYDGDNTLGTVTLGNFATGETLTYSGATASDTHVVGNKYVNAITLANGTGGGVTSNYDLPGLTGYSAGVNSVVITAKPLTLSGTRVYDGTTGFAGNVTLGGLVGTESFAITSATASSSHVATANKYISAITLGAGSNGAVASDYALPAYAYNATNNAVTISAKTLTPTLTNASATKVYDGFTNWTDTPTYSFTGFVSGDTNATLSYTGRNFNYKDVATATTVTASGLAITGITTGGNSSAATDYVLDATSKSASGATITRKDVSITSLNIADKVYDGTNNASSVQSTVLSGVVAGDTANVNTSGTLAAFGGKDVGTYSIDVTGLALTGTEANNYNLTNGTTATDSSVLITKKTVTLSASKTYDGSTSLTNFVTVGTGVTVGGITETLSYTGAVANDAHVATLNKYISAITLTDGSAGGVATNYQLPTLNVANAAVAISARTVALSASKTYDGNTSLTDAVTLTTGISGQALTYTGATANDSHVATADKYINAITLTNGTGGIATDYALPTLNSTNAAVTINAKTVGLSATKTYDGSTSLTGAVTLTTGVSGQALTYTGATANDKNVATANKYIDAITLADGTGGVATDYVLPTLNNANAAVTINAKTVTLSAAKTYDGSTSLSGFVTLGTGVGSETLTYTGAVANNAHVATLNKYISAITLADATDSSGGVASNYQLPTLDNTNAAVAISTRSITPTLTNTGTTKAYDGGVNTAITPTYSFTNLAPNDTDVTLTNTSKVFDSKDAGVATLVTVSGLAISSITGSNASAATDYTLSAASVTAAATITPKTLTVSGLAASNKVYDGSANVTITNWGNVSTAVGSETLVLNHGTASFANKTKSDGKTVTAIGYSLANGTNGGAASNYQLSSTSSTTTANITALGITLAGSTGVTKTYSGTTAMPVGSNGYGSLVGVVSGDTVTISGAPVYDSTNQGARTIAQGTVGIVGTDAANYTLTWSNGTGTINPASLTVSANADANFVTLASTGAAAYNGASYGGFVNGETTAALNIAGLTITRSGTGPDGNTGGANTLAGTYTGALTPSGVSANNGNYTISYVNGSYTIVPAGQLLVRVSNASTTYGTGANYAVSEAKYLANDATTIVNLTSSVVQSSTGNSAVQITDGASGTANFTLGPGAPQTSTASQLKAGNYTVAASSVTESSANFSNNLVVVGALAVNQKAITATATGVTKTYDGNTSMNGVTLGLTGLESSDVVTVSGNGAFEQKNVGTNLDYTVSSVTLGSTDAGNYYLSGGSTLSGSNGAISTKTVTVSATKTYDGNTTLGAGTVTVTTGVSGETLTYSGAAANSKNTGAGNYVSAITLGNEAGATTASGGLATNYALPSLSAAGAGNTVTVTPKVLAVSGIAAAGKTYDGTTSATVSTTGASYAGLVSGDAVSVAATGTFSDKNAGSGKTVTLVSSYSGADVRNYTIANQATTTAAITPQALTVSGVTAASKTYDGNTSATVSTTGASYAGLVGGDAVSVAATGTFGDKNAAIGKTVTLVSNYSGADVRNYTITDQSATTAAINAKALTVSGMTAAAKTYDGNTSATVNTAGASYAGLLGGDAVTVSATGSFSDKNAGTGKTVNLSSNYSGADVGNYAITGQATTQATISPKALTVSGISAADKTYDGTTSATLTQGTLQGLVGGDSLTLSAVGAFVDPNVGVGKTVGIQLAVGGPMAGNYSISDATTTATIKPVVTLVPPLPPSGSSSSGSSSGGTTSSGSSSGGIDTGSSSGSSSSGGSTSSGSSSGGTDTGSSSGSSSSGAGPTTTQGESVTSSGSSSSSGGTDTGSSSGSSSGGTDTGSSSGSSSGGTDTGSSSGSSSGGTDTGSSSGSSSGGTDTGSSSGSSSGGTDTGSSSGSSSSGGSTSSGSSSGGTDTGSSSGSSSGGTDTGSSSGSSSGGTDTGSSSGSSSSGGTTSSGSSSGGTDTGSSSGSSSSGGSTSSGSSSGGTDTGSSSGSSSSGGTTSSGSSSGGTDTGSSSGTSSGGSTSSGSSSGGADTGGSSGSSSSGGTTSSGSSSGGSTSSGSSSGGADTGSSSGSSSSGGTTSSGSSSGGTDTGSSSGSSSSGGTISSGSSSGGTDTGSSSGSSSSGGTTSSGSGSSSGGTDTGSSSGSSSGGTDTGSSSGSSSGGTDTGSSSGSSSGGTDTGSSSGSSSGGTDTGSSSGSSSSGGSTSSGSSSGGTDTSSSSGSSSGGTDTGSSSGSSSGGTDTGSSSGSSSGGTDTGSSSGSSSSGGTTSSGSSSGGIDTGSSSGSSSGGTDTGSSSGSSSSSGGTTSSGSSSGGTDTGSSSGSSSSGGTTSSGSSSGGTDTGSSSGSSSSGGTTSSGSSGGGSTSSGSSSGGTDTGTSSGSSSSGGTTSSGSSSGGTDTGSSSGSSSSGGTTSSGSSSGGTDTGSSSGSSSSGGTTSSGSSSGGTDTGSSSGSSSSGGTTSSGSSSGGTDTGSSSGSSSGGGTPDSPSSPNSPLGLPVQFALLGTGETAAEKSSSSSTTTASGDPGAGGFISVRNFGKLEIPAGSLFSFTLPKDTFKHADPKISVVLEARSENGPLPDWLSFDRGTGKFTGRPPESLASFTVIVTARDSSGNEASTRVVLNFTGKGNP